MTEAHSLLEKTIEEVLTTWPETAVVFKRHSMACIGCAVSQFYTIANATKVYHIPLDEFVAELEAVIGNS